MEAPSFTRGSPTLRLGWIVVRQVLPQLYIYIAYNIAYIAICKTSLATIISNNHFYPALDTQYPALWSSELFVLPPLFDPFDEARNQMNSKPISEQFDASNVI